MNKGFLLLMSAVMSLNLNASLSNTSGQDGQGVSTDRLPVDLKKLALDLQKVNLKEDLDTAETEKLAKIEQYIKEIRALALKAAFAEAQSNKPSVLDAYLKEVEAACNGVGKDNAWKFIDTPSVSHFQGCESKYGFINEAIKHPSFCQTFKEFKVQNQQ